MASTASTTVKAQTGSAASRTLPRLNTESTAALKSSRRETCTPGGVWMAVTDVEGHKSPESCGDSALEQELNDAVIGKARKVRIKVPVRSTSFATAAPMPPPL